jgi:serine protease Do
MKVQTSVEVLMKPLIHPEICLILSVVLALGLPPFLSDSALSHALTQQMPPKSSSPAQPAGRYQIDFTGLAKAIRPVVVNISIAQTIKPSAGGGGPFGGQTPFDDSWERFFGQPMPKAPFRRQGQGSGFIIEPDGLILTNHHVVADAEKITVRLQDERNFQGKVVGRDPKTDIAVIKIDATNLPVASLGNSDQLQVGEWVVALGSPFGLANTITSGIVSAKGRWIGAGPYDSFIQTDASINPGNSGGPLVNLHGEVVGINTAIFSRTGSNIGIGFAIPISLVKELLPELKREGKVTRGWLGVSIQEVTPDLAQSLGMDNPAGALVSSVVKGSPAEKAGVEVGDVITEYNGEVIEHSQQLPIIVARTKVDEQVPLKVMRGKKLVPLTVTVGELKQAETSIPASKETNLGLTVQNLTPEIARGLDLQLGQGVIITDIDPGGPAAAAGLRQGDVILEIDKKPIRGVSDYEQAIAAEQGKNLLFLLRRGDTNLFLALTQP